MAKLRRKIVTSTKAKEEKEEVALPRRTRDKNDSRHLNELAAQVIELRKRQDRVTSDCKEATLQLLSAMKEADVPKVDTPSGSCQSISSSQHVTDWGAIFEMLDPKQQELVSVSVIDPKKFQSAMDLGMVDAKLLLEHTVERPRADYVRVDYRSS